MVAWLVKLVPQNTREDKKETARALPRIFVETRPQG